jgi:hypothetical protein
MSDRRQAQQHTLTPCYGDEPDEISLVQAISMLVVVAVFKLTFPLVRAWWALRARNSGGPSN